MDSGDDLAAELKILNVDDSAITSSLWRWWWWCLIGVFIDIIDDIDIWWCFLWFLFLWCFFLWWFFLWLWWWIFSFDFADDDLAIADGGLDTVECFGFGFASETECTMERTLAGGCCLDTDCFDFTTDWVLAAGCLDVDTFDLTMDGTIAVGCLGTETFDFAMDGMLAGCCLDGEFFDVTTNGTLAGCCLDADNFDFVFGGISEYCITTVGFGDMGSFKILGGTDLTDDTLEVVALADCLGAAVIFRTIIGLVVCGGGIGLLFSTFIMAPGFDTVLPVFCDFEIAFGIGNPVMLWWDKPNHVEMDNIIQMILLKNCIMILWLIKT